MAVVAVSLWRTKNPPEVGPSTHPRPVVLSPAPAPDPRLVDRGRYLVEHVAGCLICHSQKDQTQFGQPPLPGLQGAGDSCTPDYPGTLCIPNITPDPETGIGRWTDEELSTAIREGIG